MKNDPARLGEISPFATWDLSRLVKWDKNFHVKGYPTCRLGWSIFPDFDL